MIHDAEYLNMAARKGGGRLSRSEVVSVRLDPKLRYIAELAARKQRRTVSSFIEWAVERGLDSVSAADEGQTLWNEADALWDVDESDRFTKLALRHPDLLTHEEQILWKLLRENGLLWKGRYDRNGEWQWTVSESSMVVDNLRKHWDTFKAAAAGDAEAKKILPTWVKKGSPEKKSAFDDDIPF